MFFAAVVYHLLDRFSFRQKKHAQPKLIELGRDKTPTQKKVMGGLKLLSTTVYPPNKPTPEN